MTNTSCDFIKEVLTDSADITALVGTRVYPGLLPQPEQRLSYIMFYQIDAPNIEGNAERELWRIEARSTSAILAKKLGNLIRVAIDQLCDAYTGFDVQNTFYNESTFIHEADKMYSTTLDLHVFYIRT